jgi:cell division protein FtsQ
VKRSGRSRRIMNNVSRGSQKAPRNRHKLDYLLLFYVFAVSAVITGLGAYMIKTPDLNIKDTKISGIKYCDKFLVRRIADTSIGKSIITLRKSPIADKICRIPEIESVKIGRTYPNIIWINVSERKPDAIVVNSGKYYLAQINGLVFHKIDKPIKGITLVKTFENVIVGSKIKENSTLNAFKVLTAAKKEGLRVAVISVDRKSEMCLNMVDGYYVKFGQPDNITKKITQLGSALAYRPTIANDAEYIDLSCWQAPVYKPKSSSM